MNFVVFLEKIFQGFESLKDQFSRYIELLSLDDVFKK